MQKLRLFKGNYDGISYRATVTNSRKKAMILMNVNPRDFKDYFSVVDKEDEINSIIWQSPGRAFQKLITNKNDNSLWQEI